MVGACEIILDPKRNLSISYVSNEAAITDIGLGDPPFPLASQLSQKKLVPVLNRH